MAQNQTGNEWGVVDKRLAANTYGSYAENAHDGTSTANAKDVTALRTRLAAISATTYTEAVLDKMTVNDMLYALRVNDEAAGI
jgi:hypothetical protein